MLVQAPIWAWGASYMQGVLSAEGVEGRSPLLDRRIIDFAVRRPIEERTVPGETKRLLRAAMSGLLPESFLAPRARRTGATVAYSARRMREAYPSMLDELFGHPLVLAEIGAVDRPALQEAARAWRSGNDTYRVDLFHLMKVEFWLRAQRESADRNVPPLAESLVSPQNSAA